MTRRANSRIVLAALLFVAETSGCTHVNSQDVRLIVTDKGKYILDGKTYTLSELAEGLRTLKAQRPSVNLHVSGSSKVTYEQLAPAMKIAQAQGLASPA